MSWLNTPLASSFMALLGSTEGAARVQKERVETIRTLMLEEMGNFGTINSPKIMRNVRYATDALNLWYARGDVMAVLSAQYGETAAHEKIKHISGLFKGLLPPSMSSRPSSLGR